MEPMTLAFKLRNICMGSLPKAKLKAMMATSLHPQIIMNLLAQLDVLRYHPMMSPERSNSLSSLPSKLPQRRSLTNKSTHQAPAQGEVLQSIDRYLNRIRRLQVVSLRWET
jgi:hypothetical protein